MNRFIRSIIIALTLSAGAAAESSYHILDSLYNRLSLNPNARICNIKFTGSDSNKSGGGFKWQRGSGAGWTSGKRITISEAEADDAAAVDEVFRKVALRDFVVRYNDHSSATLIEPENTIFIYDYDPVRSRLCFLKASTTGEICIPNNWITTDSVNATIHNPLEFASASEMAQLGLSRLWAEARRNFVFMDRAPVDWDSLYVANMRPVAEAAAAGDNERVGEILQLIAAKLGDGHTYVYGYERSKRYTPIATVLIDGHVYVDSIAGGAFESEGIRCGMELVSINGIPAIEYGRKRIMPYISSSTPQWSDYMTFNGYNLLAAHEGDTLRMQFSNGKNTVGVDYVAGSRNFTKPSAPRALGFDMLSGNIGHLRISNFMDADFKDSFDHLYPEILKTKALIIDLRGNGGGNSNNADHILRHLTDQKIKTDPWTSPAYIPAYASWNRQQPLHHSEEDYMEPYNDRPAYTRPIALITDGGTFSAAEDFTAIFRGMKRGKIVGSPTGGSTGNGVRVTLIPGVAYANICSKHDVAPDGTEFVGIGIIPDVEVRETFDTHFGRSAALAAALRLLKAEASKK